MNAFALKFACGSLLLAAVALGTALSADGPVTPREESDEEIEPTVAGRSTTVTSEQIERRKKELLTLVPQWRETYAYKSLAARLEYEQDHRDDKAPPLSAASKTILDDVEKSSAADGFGHYRSESLRLLHTESVEEFVKRDGFGVGRVAFVAGPNHVVFDKPRPIPFEAAPVLSAKEDSTPRRPLSRRIDGRHDGGAVKLPPLDVVADYHATSRDRFLSPYLFGHVESVDRVAGFVPHAFVTMPWSNDETFRAGLRHNGLEGAQWNVARLELVSLLKHDEPRVYLSESLPRMEDLSSVKTRPLNDFEVAGLGVLRSGDDLHTAATPNRIEMVGALRASKNCMECHEVPRGTLLGAFSYDLRRDPPIALPPAEVTQ